MVQMNHTLAAAPMIPDPRLGKILALGIKPIPEPPKIHVQTADGVCIGLMPSGKVSVFFGGRVAACECSGKPVEALPSEARFVAAIAVDLQPVKVYRTLGEFYSVRGSQVVAMATNDECDRAHQTPDIQTPDDKDPVIDTWYGDDDADSGRGNNG